MQDFQQRVIDEKADLDGKISRLDAFNIGPKYQTLSSDERGRLARQLAVMKEYSEILGDRIAAFV